MAGEGSSPALNAGGGRYLAFLYSYLAFINICICFFVFVYFCSSVHRRKQNSQAVQLDNPIKPSSKGAH